MSGLFCQIFFRIVLLQSFVCVFAVAFLRHLALPSGVFHRFAAGFQPHTIHANVVSNAFVSLPRTRFVFPIVFYQFIEVLTVFLENIFPQEKVTEKSFVLFLRCRACVAADLHFFVGHCCSYPSLFPGFVSRTCLRSNVYANRILILFVFATALRLCFIFCRCWALVFLLFQTLKKRRFALHLFKPRWRLTLCLC